MYELKIASMAARKHQRAYVETPLGNARHRWFRARITQIDLLRSARRCLYPRPSRPASSAKAARQLEEYFNGRRREFDLPLDLRNGRVRAPGAQRACSRAVREDGQLRRAGRHGRLALAPPEPSATSCARIR